ncbi:endogenous retrovirus group 3 member 1 Env polyprotein [Ornithorhynchus anatinus]|uniref:endogenous retrovirus group 3 member 1 Env polyprotein n=1 Tax=Ornithorhynchus anatinus TaxID=9258 RepID=UPI0004547EEE|nr:endogenous retrovirus group 3 member 1 Env polyprotein [Ornithorhynchus anatinus]
MEVAKSDVERGTNSVLESSKQNRGKLCRTCEWKGKQKLWKCQYDHNYGAGPLGLVDQQYYPNIRDSENRTRIFKEKQPALKGHYWICGKTAYTHLPLNWTGVCYIGLIRPKFSFLPEQAGKHLAIPLYEEMGRLTRSIDTSLTQAGNANGRVKEWPPERIIKEYGPATWAQGGSWRYRTPIYMLNRLIRLQAVVEVITNQTAKALDLLADQATQTWEAEIQHSLVEVGGVCGKLNLTNCCMKIDDNGRLVKEITQDIRKLAYVPVQTWSSPYNSSWWVWFGGSWWK